MLIIFTTSYVVLTIALGLFQTVYVVLYVRFMNQGMRPDCSVKPHDSGYDQLHAAVILCLRGLDPSLEQCLAAISNQSYTSFELHLVFDDVDDPAVGVATRTLQSSGLATVPAFHFIDHSRFQQGSLKCHALVSAIEAIQLRRSGEPDQSGPEPVVDVVALVDADCIVDQHWLRDLIAPFDSPDVAATTGNRWFEPGQDEPGKSNLGSQMRMIWNAAAIVQMYLYDIPWGGSLAIRFDSLQQTGLIEKWKTAFCEDTMIAAHFREHSGGSHVQRVVRVPNLVVENRETTGLNGAFRWVTRQLLTVRLYHPSWPFVLLHALTIAVSLAALPALLIVAIASGHWQTASIPAAAGAAYQLVNYLLIGSIASSNRRILALRRVDASSTRSDRTEPVLKLNPFAVLTAQLVQPGAAIAASFKRIVHWRGIQYRIERRQVQMQQYRAWNNIRSSEYESTETTSVH